MKLILETVGYFITVIYCFRLNAIFRLLQFVNVVFLNIIASKLKLGVNNCIKFYYSTFYVNISIFFSNVFIKTLFVCSNCVYRISIMLLLHRLDLLLFILLFKYTTQCCRSCSL